MKRLFWLLIIVLSLNNLYGFGENNKGKTAFQSLKIGVGARPVAMGEAFTAVSDDINAIYWNPAGVVNVDCNELSVMYINWFQKISYSSLAFVHNFMHNIAVGVFFSQLSYGRIPKTEVTADGSLIDNNESYTAYDLIGGLSSGIKVSENLLLGVNIKLLTEKIENEKAQGIAFDIGWLWNIIKNRLRYGVSLNNIGTNIRFISEKDNLPLSFKVGLAYIKQKRFTISFDMSIPSDNTMSEHIGIEYYLFKNFCFRVGYKSNTIRDLGGLSGLSAGVGIKWKHLSIDYVWVPYGELGQTQRCALKCSF